MSKRMCAHFFFQNETTTLPQNQWRTRQTHFGDAVLLKLKTAKILSPFVQSFNVKDGEPLYLPGDWYAVSGYVRVEFTEIDRNWSVYHTTTSGYELTMKEASLVYTSFALEIEGSFYTVRGTFLRTGKFVPIYIKS
ncbi:hypothetical protein [Bacillus fonticola]|uniref:hypothetical protein n=1 Tax=Bacillus fonticola TaxID=2728853 RepID=UPI0014741E0F|nr:hypothetical protein [Bacillus fonticola]